MAYEAAPRRRDDDLPACGRSGPKLPLGLWHNFGDDGRWWRPSTPLRTPIWRITRSACGQHGSQLWPHFAELGPHRDVYRLHQRRAGRCGRSLRSGGGSRKYTRRLDEGAGSGSTTWISFIRTASIWIRPSRRLPRRSPSPCSKARRCTWGFLPTQPGRRPRWPSCCVSGKYHVLFINPRTTCSIAGSRRMGCPYPSARLASGACFQSARAGSDGT